jgi:tRNA modification GTPase
MGYPNKGGSLSKYLFLALNAVKMPLHSNWEDTIVALATPPGIGAIGVVRLSGSRALEIANELFSSKNLLLQATHTAHVGVLKENNVAIDEVLLTLFKAPKSYTGENVVEISGHGSPFVLQKIIEACIRKGARLAGEFTLRAFLKGKLDLTQAEAVADLIASNTEASRQTALKNIRGGFSTILKELREELIQFSALIELELDFSQEDVEFADRTKLFALVNHLQQTTNSLLQSFQLGNVIKNGVQVAIIGKPNAGKSTLLNTLLNENRAIVSEIAGTTRDTIEEVLNIEGVLFRLIDTAGIREHSGDVIESIGMGKSYEKAGLADIILYIYDCNKEDSGSLANTVEWLQTFKKPYLLVANKSDLLNGELVSIKEEKIIPISAQHNTGVIELKKILVKASVQGDVYTESSIITNLRHYEALQQLKVALTDVEKGMNEKIPGDLLSLDIRRCLHLLGEITGEITNEDQLDYIFSKFCIGK